MFFNHKNYKSLHHPYVYKIKNIVKYIHMKHVYTLILIFAILNINSAFADGDLWENFGDQNFYGNKAVSEQEFQKAIETKKGENPPKKKRGSSFHQGNETEIINQKAEELPILCVTADVKLNEDAILPVGHYQLMSEKVNNRIYLKLYQGHYLMAEIEAYETIDDFDQPEINFAEFIPDGNNYKIIYGSVDYNAYANLEAVPIE